MSVEYHLPPPDHVFVKPDPAKRGAKPHNDSAFIELALAGKNSGNYRTASEAARDLSKLDKYSVEACYRRLLRKFKPLF
ncbi:MAG: hypothetical protein WA842_02445 [Croceibacterium sp.]